MTNNKVTDNIEGFKEHYSFLSNYFPCTFVWGGVEWKSAEHAYQAAKTDDAFEQQRISKLKTPSGATKAGHKVLLREHWEQKKDAVMYSILMNKFRQNPQLIDELLQTDDCTLLNTNDWGDMYWGVSPLGEGENKLGKLLMQLRNWFRVLEYVLCLDKIEKTRDE